MAISWHGVKPGEPDWSEHSHSLAFMVSGAPGRGEEGAGGALYAAFNMHKEPLPFVMPRPPDGTHWHLMADTARPSPHDIHEPGSEPAMAPAAPVVLAPYSVVLCVGHG